MHAGRPASGMHHPGACFKRAACRVSATLEVQIHRAIARVTHRVLYILLSKAHVRKLSIKMRTRSSTAVIPAIARPRPIYVRRCVFKMGCCTSDGMLNGRRFGIPNILKMCLSVLDWLGVARFQIACRDPDFPGFSTAGQIQTHRNHRYGVGEGLLCRHYRSVVRFRVREHSPPGICGVPPLALRPANNPSASELQQPSSGTGCDSTPQSQQPRSLSGEQLGAGGVPPNRRRQRKLPWG